MTITTMIRTAMNTETLLSAPSQLFNQSRACLHNFWLTRTSMAATPLAAPTVLIPIRRASRRIGHIVTMKRSRIRGVRQSSIILASKERQPAMWTAYRGCVEQWMRKWTPLFKCVVGKWAIVNEQACLFVGVFAWMEIRVWLLGILTFLRRKCANVECLSGKEKFRRWSAFKDEISFWEKNVHKSQRIHRSFIDRWILIGASA